MTLSLFLAASITLAYSPPASPLPIESAAEIRRIHVDDFEGHAHDPPRERSPSWIDHSVHTLSTSSGPTREILGYLPYWELDYDSFHWDKLTTLAFFAANMESDGSLSNLHGWDGATSTALRDEAHMNGVRYILTVINFSPSSIETLVNDPVARSNGVQQLLGAVMAMEADGVNIDFEGVPLAAKAGLTAFVQETTEAFHSNIPGSQVTVATPAVDWAGAFDYDQLAIHSDGLMIMGYGYHWKKGNPGPLSPVTSGEIWGEKTLTWTIDDYFQWGGPENHHKYILGLPFYGRDWPSIGPEIPGTAVADGAAEPFRDCKPRAEALGGFQWDPHSQSTYFMEQKDGTWHQIWCDDGPSWSEKLALIEQYDLLGVGIWALGYDGTTEDYWDAIGEAFLPEPIEPGTSDEDAGAGGGDAGSSPDAGSLEADAGWMPDTTKSDIETGGDVDLMDDTSSSPSTTDGFGENVIEDNGASRTDTDRAAPRTQDAGSSSDGNTREAVGAGRDGADTNTPRDRGPSSSQSISGGCSMGVANHVHGAPLLMMMWLSMMILGWHRQSNR